MRKTRHELNLYALYDHTSMVRHLERMAVRGWRLEHIGAFWRYRRAEPKPLRYCIAYYPAASVYDPITPSEGEQSFWDYCAAAGWKKAANNAQLHIFCNEDMDAVPIETDAELQVDTVHRAMKKSLVLSNIITLFLGMLYLYQSFDKLRDRPVEYFSSINSLALSVDAVLLLLLGASALLGYFRWHRRAVKAAEAGHFLPTRSHPWAQAAAIIAAFLLIFCYAGSSLFSGPRGLRTFIAVFGYVLILFGCVRGTHALLRCLNASRKTNLIITILVDVVLAVGMMSFLTSSTLRDWIFVPPENATPYEWRGGTDHAYHDPLPLYWEDFTKTDYDSWSCELTEQRSPLMTYTRYSQDVRWGEDAAPGDLFYSVTETPIRAILDFCLQRHLSYYERRGYNDYPSTPGEWYDIQDYVESDPTPWGAERALQLRHNWNVSPSDDRTELENIWVLDYGDRFVVVNTSDLTPDPAQMAIIGEKLRS